jgi:hypothetical protein
LSGSNYNGWGGYEEDEEENQKERIHQEKLKKRREWNTENREAENLRKKLSRKNIKSYTDMGGIKNEENKWVFG